MLVDIKLVKDDKFLGKKLLYIKMLSRIPPISTFDESIHVLVLDKNPQEQKNRHEHRAFTRI